MGSNLHPPPPMNRQIQLNYWVCRDCCSQWRGSSGFLWVWIRPRACRRNLKEQNAPFISQGLWSLEQCPAGLPSHVPQRLKGALSPPGLLLTPKFPPILVKILLWGRDTGSKSHLTVLWSDMPVIYFLPSNRCQTPSTFQAAP